MLKNDSGKFFVWEQLHHLSMFKNDLIRVFIAFLGCLYIIFIYKNLSITNLSFILLLVIITSFPIVMEALENLKERHMTMELSMVIAFVAALIIDEFLTVFIIITFVLIADMLEDLTVERGKRAVNDILSYLPQTITILENGVDKEIAIKVLKTNDIVLIKPGLKIPIDGSVLFGKSFVDQSVITGESIPVEKTVGSNVYAGSINQLGTLHVKTEKLGSQTIFGSIVEEIEKANKSKAPIQKTADKLAVYLVYFALISAFLTYFITHSEISAISVIIVAGACGIAAGTPLAILGAMGQATMLKTIIKGGVYLEKLASIDTVILDKTGTLTLGKPEVLEIRTQPSISAEELIHIASSVERYSEHPIAQSIIKKAKDLNLTLYPIEDFQNIPGNGVTGIFNNKKIFVGSKEWLLKNGIKIESSSSETKTSDIHVAYDYSYLGCIEIADKMRNESRAFIQDLHNLNIYTILLSGDNPIIANQIGNELTVKETHGGLFPMDKTKWVEKYKNEGKVIAMIGDGINDALAIKTADVGISMGSGTDFTKETSDIVLLGNDLGKFIELLRLSKRTKRIIWENVYGTFIIDTIGIILASLGILNPVIAAFVHVTSELVFIFNSARLIPYNKRKETKNINIKDAKEINYITKSIHDLSPS